MADYNNIQEHFTWIDTAYRKTRFMTIALVVFSVITMGIVLFFAFSTVIRSRDTVFVVDQGSTVAATIASNGVQRDQEVEDHVTRFHELMFNLAPSQESHDRRFEAAFNMADRSAYEYWNDQNETGYYSRLISANISQEIIIDSVKFTMTRYPYPAQCFGKVQLVRDSNVTRYEFESSCELRDVARSRLNPHGLMIEKFKVTRYDLAGTRRRR